MKRAHILNRLFDMWEVTDGQMKLYIERLESIPDGELLAVINQALDTFKFRPTVAELKELHQQMRTGSGLSAAEEGWLSVQRAMRDPASYSPDPEGKAPKFKDPITAKVVAAMGWHNLRMSTQPRVDQAQFIKMYDAFAAHRTHEQRLLPEYKELRAERQLPQQETNDGYSIISVPSSRTNGTNGSA